MKNIVKAVRAVVNLTERTIRSDIASLGIKPVGAFHQRPCRYPAYAASLILSNRGYQTALLPPADTAAARIDSMLRTERKGKARR